MDVLHEINDIMNEEWATEIVDSSFVLGVKRERGHDADGKRYCKMSMTSFISDLYSAFQEEYKEAFPKKKTYKTAFPENIMLSKSIDPGEGEVKRNIDRGYQRLIGSLLWAVRHVYPQCAYGCSQLCKLMSAPTDLAWLCALHMLGYMYQEREMGIKLSETTSNPCAFVDASNKDDPVDGKCQYGYHIHWGGPLITKSSKLNHPWESTVPTTNTWPYTMQ